MDMTVTFPGNLKVAAAYRGFTIATDQSPEDGGDGTAPAPFDLFLASLATCAGIYMLRFLRSRNLSAEDASLAMHMERDEETNMLRSVTLDLHLPPGFPEKYCNAVINAVNLCAVKKHLLAPPEITVVTTLAGEPAHTTVPALGPDPDAAAGAAPSAALG
ncbi:MAG: osmotically inducible protein OsmC [Actinobacteria bacterium]|nr:osmotically inducible protein OsmC [Actinomycetota bacterium]